jgi:hypothetical protein
VLHVNQSVAHDSNPLAEMGGIVPSLLSEILKDTSNALSRF